MKKLLVVRNDRLGDLMLILPALRIIKSSIENIEIDCYVNEKYKDIKLVTEYIDNTICGHDDLVRHIDRNNYDYAISFFSTFKTGFQLWKSNIKKRYAPSTKIAQIFYNRKISQNRSSSKKSEYEYNNDIAKYFLEDNSYSITDINKPYITLRDTQRIMDMKKPKIFVHPFTGGSSKTLSDNDFIELCKQINKNGTYSFVLHCDKNDYDKCKALSVKFNGLDIQIIDPTDSIVEMFHNINQCDVFIAGSTGPLHVAAALNKKTVGFYPSKLSSIVRRWDTINLDSNKLSFTDIGADKEYIKVDLSNAANMIRANFLD